MRSKRFLRYLIPRPLAAGIFIQQAIQPFLNPVEMALPSIEEVLHRIAESDNVNHEQYHDLFELVYGIRLNKLKSADKDILVEVYFDKVTLAIAAFEKSQRVNPFSSKFDYFLAGNTVLTANELNGLELSEGKAGCSICHDSAPDLGLGGCVEI